MWSLCAIGSWPHSGPCRCLSLFVSSQKHFFPGFTLIFLLRVFPLQLPAVQLAGLAGLRKNVAGLVILEDFLGEAFLENVLVVLDELVVMVADFVERLVVYFIPIDFLIYNFPVS